MNTIVVTDDTGIISLGHSLSGRKLKGSDRMPASRVLRDLLLGAGDRIISHRQRLLSPTSHLTALARSLSQGMGAPIYGVLYMVAPSFTWPLHLGIGRPTLQRCPPAMPGGFQEDL